MSSETDLWATLCWWQYSTAEMNCCSTKLSAACGGESSLLQVKQRWVLQPYPKQVA